MTLIDHFQFEDWEAIYKDGRLWFDDFTIPSQRWIELLNTSRSPITACHHYVKVYECFPYLPLTVEELARKINGVEEDE